MFEDRCWVELVVFGLLENIDLALGGIDRGLLDGKPHPCPKCGGKDRFRLIDEADGALFCNQCFDHDNGDGLSALQWLTGWDFKTTCKKLGDYLGLAPVNGHAVDIIADTARDKGMPIESFKAFGVRPGRRAGRDVARVPVYNEEGEKDGHFDLWPGSKGKFKKGGSHGLFLPDRRPRQGETWVVVEGVKDSAALVGMGYWACGLPMCEMAERFVRLFRGIDVILCPDLDKAGQDGCQRSAARLHGEAASVRIATLPGEVIPTGGDDVRDVLAREGGETLVRLAIETAIEWNPAAAKTLKRRITVDFDEERVIDEAIDVLADLGGGIYQRAGILTHVVRDSAPSKVINRPAGCPRITPLELSRLRELLAVAADWGEGDDFSRCHPPHWVCDGIMGRKQWQKIPPISAAVTVPTLRFDGTVLQRPGFDADTGIYYRPEMDFPAVPDSPTQADAKGACVDLLEVVSDFPFESPEHKSVWLAAVLSPLARHAYEGPTPLCLIDANVRGVGKGLLAHTAAMIATGQHAPTTTLPRSDEEFRKRITAIALAADPVMLIDNVVGDVNLPSFDAVLTAPVWTDRVLGMSTMTGAMPLTTCWFMTGNNVSLGGDTIRRSMHCRLESKLERPEERPDFQHGNLLAWLTGQRARLVVSALTILRGYVVAGRPKRKLTPWGSFEGWSDLVRQAVVWAGQPDPGKTRRQLAETADDEVTALRRLLCALDDAVTLMKQIERESQSSVFHDGISVKQMTNGDVAGNLSYHLSDQVVEELTEAASDLPGIKVDKNGVDSRSLGRKLAHLRRRVVDGMFLDRERSKHTNYWFVQHINPTKRCDHDRSLWTRDKTLTGDQVTCRCGKYIGRLPPAKEKDGQVLK